MFSNVLKNYKINSRLSNYLFPASCLLAAILSQYSGLDIYLAKLFYNSETHQWLYQSSWLTQVILHDDAKRFISVIYFLLLAMFLLSLIKRNMQPYRRMLGYILLSSLTGIMIIAYLKESTHLYTPWDMIQFGGSYPNIRLFDSVAEGLPVGNAFPSGHASGGYALFSLYFAAEYCRSRYSLILLYAVLSLGLILGIDQQVRGAHMLSHDLVSIAICWLSALFWSFLFLPPRKFAQTE